MSEMVETQLSSIPILPLRDVVVYPHMVIPLFVGREKSIQALEAAMDNGKQILLVAQKSAAKDEPSQEDLYEIGTVSSILQLLKLPDGTVKVLVEGNKRARIVHFLGQEEYFTAQVKEIDNEIVDERESEVLVLAPYNGNASYLWQDSSTNNSFNVVQEGEYYVELTNACSLVSDTLEVRFKPLPKPSQKVRKCPFFLRSIRNLHTHSTSWGVISDGSLMSCLPLCLR